MFADRATIVIKSGAGGNGCVSFRREKYVPNGGPDGGDGGRGGSIVFVVSQGMNTLSRYRYKQKYSAQNGEDGSKRNCHGKNGEDLVLNVPEGTLVKDAATDRIIADMSGANTRQVILKGGKGGLGNQHFATATMQAPKYAQPGQEAIEIEVLLELKVIADVGLVGFPNVGKSTFLSRVTNAQPKIANYHFTTLSPNLGVVDFKDGRGFVIADIPGLIEGASSGIGLGHEFLRHIERTKILIHMIDAASTEGRDPIADIYAINKELSAYDPKLLQKQQIIAANKIDAIYEGENDIIAKLKSEFEKQGFSIFPISAVSGKGLKELLYEIASRLENLDDMPITYEQEYDPSWRASSDEGYTVKRMDDASFVLEGPKIEKMLGYTNIDSEKGFLFFQKFLKEQGIIKELEEYGIEDGDTVRIYGHEFDYYK